MNRLSLAVLHVENCRRAPARGFCDKIGTAIMAYQGRIGDMSTKAADGLLLSIPDLDDFSLAAAAVQRFDEDLVRVRSEAWVGKETIRLSNVKRGPCGAVQLLDSLDRILGAST
jgi:hypothetical protein